MGWSTQGDVVFDWDGSLRLARRLWAAADALDGIARARRGEAEGALVEWLGPFADEFVVRQTNADDGATTVSTGLRDGAHAWAEMWRQAMDQQNRILHARAETRARDSRSTWDSISGALFGHDDLPSPPSPAVTPAAPDFSPTRDFARY